MQKSKDNNNLALRQKAVIIIQKNWKRFILRKNFKKALKQLKRKNFTAFQLLSSQRTYCDHLKFIIKQVLQASKKAIDDQQLHQILFCNIKQIFMMHYVFLYKLQQIMKNFHTHKTQISKALKQLFSQDKFQQSYTEYCYNYPKADKIIKILSENNSALKEILKKTGLLNSVLNLQSYMIKPVQRLCKYQLMLGQYFKCMQIDHPDYSGIKQIINIIKNLVNATNSQVQQYLFLQRFKQLKYNNSQIFLKYPQNKQRPRKLVYQLNSSNITLYNILKQQQISIQSIVIFNDIVLVLPFKQKPIMIKILYLRKIQNMKYFKNILQIIDHKKYYTFQFKQEKQRNQLIEVIQTKTNYLIEKPSFYTVQVLGTQRRQSFFKFFTVYIVQINQNNKITKIYPRFKNLLKVQDILMKKNWFLQINVPPLQKQAPFQTLKSKTIEKRKLHIREFLQRILNNKRIMQNDQIRQTLQYHEGKTPKKAKNEQQDEILILLPNWQHIKVHLNAKFSKIKDLKSKICLQLQFIHNNQFQVFEIRNKNYSSKRLMYDDQSCLPILQSQETLLSNPFTDKLQYMFSRHYYLSSQQQLSLYKIDFIRLQLQLSVIRTQILTYGLQEQLMITFMCLFAMYINLPYEEDKINNLVKDIGKKMYKVPLNQFTIYYNQVQKIVQSEQDQAVTVPFLIIKILSNNRLYQCQQFQVQIHKKCYQNVKKQISSSIQQKIILGIKLNTLMLLTLKQKHLIKTIEYNDIQSMEMYPNGIVFKFNNLSTIFRIKTTQAYQIHKLITIYSQRKIVLENNSNIIVRNQNCQSN